MKHRILFLFLISFLSTSAHADPKVEVCKRDSSFTSNKDTGFYMTFFDLQARRKIVDNYGFFYHSLSDHLADRANQLCTSPKSNEEVILALDGFCHAYCDNQAPKFVKTLGWFSGGHLVAECHQVCSARTEENRGSFPDSPAPSVSGVEISEQNAKAVTTDAR